jgi:hypothetical protein
MSKETQNEFMLLFRGTAWHKGLSPEQMQKVASQWMDWFKGLMEKGIAADGRPLENSGKIVSGKNGRMVADGPFAESKEAIGGYFMLRVNSIDEAVAVAKHCPGLAYGVEVEVRQLLHECPLSKQVVPEPELAGAAA